MKSAEMQLSTNHSANKRQSIHALQLVGYKTVRHLSQIGHILDLI